MTFPRQSVSLDRACIYSWLAWMQRHRARTGPRALRFELQPAASPRLILEPWNRSFVSHTTRYEGAQAQTVRIWNARRLLGLSHVLPWLERIDVHLLGTGLPNFWAASLGELQLTIGNTGFALNDWLRSEKFEELLPQQIEAEAATAERLAARDLTTRHKALVTGRQDSSRGLTRMAGVVDRLAVEFWFDADGLVHRARCPCSYYRRCGTIDNPCRHLRALRHVAQPMDEQ